MFIQQSVFAQHYVTQIIHTCNTLCNSCHFWINCSLFGDFFLSLSLSQRSQSSGFLHPPMNEPCGLFWLTLRLTPPAAGLSLSDTVINEAPCSQKLLRIPAPGTCRGEKWPLDLFSRTTRPGRCRALKNQAPVSAIENRLGDNRFHFFVLCQQATETLA